MLGADVKYNNQSGVEVSVGYWVRMYGVYVKSIGCIGHNGMVVSGDGMMVCGCLINQV